MHLLLFGAFAWILPTFLSLQVNPNQEIGSMLDTSFMIQIAGYFLAMLVALAFVMFRQNGEWGSLGLGWSHTSSTDLAMGGVLGLGMFALYLPIGILLNNGTFGISRMEKILIGEPSGFGVFLAGVVVVIGAPIIEETFFRGMLFEKIARTDPKRALVVTSILFMLAHGLIAPIQLMVGLVLGRMRMKGKSLWFTIAGHAAWNLSVMLVAAAVVFSPNVSFSTTDEAYELRYPAKWERIEEAEMVIPGGNIDFAIEAPNGSAFFAMRFTVPAGTDQKHLKALMKQGMAMNPMATVQLDPKIESNAILGEGLIPSWTMAASFTDPTGVSGRLRAWVALPPAATEAYMFLHACPTSACTASEAQADEMVSSVSFSS